MKIWAGSAHHNHLRIIRIFLNDEIEKWGNWVTNQMHSNNVNANETKL